MDRHQNRDEGLAAEVKNLRTRVADLEAMRSQGLDAQAALRESLAKYRALFDGAGDAIFTVQLLEPGNARIVDCNPRAVEMFGYSREELLAGGPMLLIPERQPDGRPSLVLVYELLDRIGADEPRLLEFQHRRKDGTLFDAEVTGSNLELDGGVQYQAIVRDLSERRQAEAERLALEAQIQHAQKLESLGMLAGGIAHDFSNYLMAILGNAELIKLDLPLASPLRENVDSIVEASRRATDLCRQLLSYAGKGRFDVKPLHLSQLVAEMAQMLTVSISKRVSLSYDFAEILPAVRGDGTQLRQVVLNLITNAAEAIGRERGSIAVSTGTRYCDAEALAGTEPELELPEGNYVFLEVRDSGVGMDEETRARLFDPFFTTKVSGRGLGLSAVLGIVRSHGGCIRVESEPGRGSTIRVLLPAMGQEAVWEEDRADGDGGPLRAGTILLADDEQSVREVTCAMLENAGFAVIATADGREALGAFQARKDEIDCALLDLAMPVLDGHECLRELRALRPDLPVLLTSGYHETEPELDGGPASPTVFLRKPFQVAELLAAMRSLLDAGNGPGKT